MVVNAQSKAKFHKVDSVATCVSYTWDKNNTTYTEGGAYTVYVADTLFILDLTIYPEYLDTVPLAVKGGCTYTVEDTTFTESGIYRILFKSVHGCDSVKTINLTLDTVSQRLYNVSACEEYTWKGETYTESQVIFKTDTTGTCDSILTMSLYIKKPSRVVKDTLLTGCEFKSYRFFSQSSDWIDVDRDSVVSSEPYTRKASAAVRRIFHPREVDKCYDSIIMANFVIKYTSYNRMTVAECDSYTLEWSDSSKTYLYTMIDTVKCPRAASGCDSLIILDLTINKTPDVVVSGDLRVHKGDNAVLKVKSSVENVDFTWSNGETTDSIVLTDVRQNTDVSVTGVSAASGCARTTYVTVMANDGIADANTATVAIYPNPTTSAVTIGTDEDVKSVNVYNISGQRVMSVDGSRVVDMSKLSNGSYVLRIELQNGMVGSGKVMLNK